MTDKEFIEMVAAMRLAQQQYFKTRMSSYLEKAKKLEKQVDDYLLSYGKKKRKK